MAAIPKFTGAQIPAALLGTLVIGHFAADPAIKDRAQAGRNFSGVDAV